MFFCLSKKTNFAIFPKVSPNHRKKSHINQVFLSSSAQHKDHGEDAVYVAQDLHVVADGVGGTKTSSAAFAKRLVNNFVQVFDLQRQEKENPAVVVDLRMLKRTLWQAASMTRHEFLHVPTTVAATLSVTFMDRQAKMIHCLTIGDSKTIVIRKEQVAFESTSVIKGFNVPAVVSNKVRFSYEANAQTESFGILPGDVIVTSSDGMSDNLFEQDILQIVAKHRGFGAEKIAKELVQLSLKKAQEHDLTDKFTSPFALSAAIELQQRAENLPQELFPHSLRMLFSKTAQACASSGILDKQTMMIEEDDTVSMRYHYSIEKLERIARSSTGKMDDITIATALIL